MQNEANNRQKYLKCFKFKQKMQNEAKQQAKVFQVFQIKKNAKRSKEQANVIQVFQIQKNAKEGSMFSIQKKIWFPAEVPRSNYSSNGRHQRSFLPLPI